MTIREYVKRRVRFARYFAALWILVLLILGFTVFPALMGKDGGNWMLLGLLPIAAAFYIIGRQTKCPRCVASLQIMTIEAIVPFRGSIPDRCPHCAVNLDEPMR
jgi:hypothetical protein